MAKQRNSFANLCKGKPKEDGTKGTNYVKVFRPVALAKGDIVNLETKQARLDSLKSAISAGKLEEGEYTDKLLEEINKMPEYVLAELVVYKEKPAALKN